MDVIRHSDPDEFIAAAAPMAARELLAHGKRRLFLATDTTNPTSNAIRARVGLAAGTDECHIDFVDGAT